MASITKRGKTYRVRWIDHEGNRQSATFHSQREAFEFVRRREVEVDDIKRGIKTPIPLNATVNEALDYWCAQRAPTKRSCRDDLSIIKAHLRPTFGHLLLRQLSVSHTDEYIKEKSKLNPKTVSNHLTLLITILNTAVDLGWLDKIPNIKKPRVVLFPDDYSFLRTDDEIDRLLTSALIEGPLVFIFYKTTLNTGMRAGEVAALRVEDIDFSNRLIRIQRSFGGPTKSGKVRYVPIMDVLYDDLLSWVREKGAGLVFPNQAGRMHTPASRIFQETLHRVLKHAGFSGRTVGKRERPYITFHDLRHTFASHWMMNGGDVFKLQKILGHQSIQMTMRYTHLAPNAFGADLGRFGSRQVCQSGNVIPLARSPSKKT